GWADDAGALDRTGRMSPMPVYLAWTSHSPVLDPDASEPEPLEGPWTELREAAPGVLLVESDEHLSAVYHAIKWALPDGAALLVQPVTERPKLKGLAPGTTTWFRDRVP